GPVEARKSSTPCVGESRKCWLDPSKSGEPAAVACSDRLDGCCQLSGASVGAAGAACSRRELLRVNCVNDSLCPIKRASSASASSASLLNRGSAVPRVESEERCDWKVLSSAILIPFGYWRRARSLRDGTDRSTCPTAPSETNASPQAPRRRAERARTRER